MSELWGCSPPSASPRLRLTDSNLSPSGSRLWLSSKNCSHSDAVTGEIARLPPDQCTEVVREVAVEGQVTAPAVWKKHAER